MKLSPETTNSDSISDDSSSISPGILLSDEESDTLFDQYYQDYQRNQNNDSEKTLVIRINNNIISNRITYRGGRHRKPRNRFRLLSEITIKNNQGIKLDLQNYEDLTQKRNYKKIIH